MLHVNKLATFVHMVREIYNRVSRALCSWLSKAKCNYLLKSTLYIIADASDNSITLSKRLFEHMGGMNLETAKVFVFYIPDDHSYGFTLNPLLETQTDLYDIQYNEKYKTIGFSPLVPTVNRIFYDYGIDAEKSVKLSIKICKSKNMIYYKICRPNEKLTRK